MSAAFGPLVPFADLRAMGIRITTQQFGNRWGYVIDKPGFCPYVSGYRWASMESALRAGRRDAEGTVALRISRAIASFITAMVEAA